MKKILLPTDFSETAMKALKAAVLIGNKEKSELILMHSSLPTEGVNNNVYAAIYIHEYLEIKRKNLNQLIDKVKELGYEGEIKTDNKVDFTVPAIVHTAEEFDVDLLVMGSTGASGVTGLVLGSTAGGVLSKVDYPLFLIPKDFELSEGGNLLIGTDYKTSLDERSAGVLKFFKDALGYKLHLIHIEQEGDETPDKEAYINENYSGIIDSSVSVAGEKVEDALMKIKEKYSNAILCTVSKKKSWFENLFSHSVSKSLTQYSDIPLLCLHAD